MEVDAELCPPKLTFVMTIQVQVAAPVELGEVHGVSRRVIAITGGSFKGPMLEGEVLPGGADWQHTRPDEVAVLEARYTLKTSEGEFISITNSGFRHGPPGLAATLASGKYVPPSQYYFMTAPCFETASPALQWLTRSLFLGQSQRTADRVLVNVWQVGGGII